MEGILAPPSLETIRGTQAHEREQQVEQEQFEFVTVTPEEISDISHNMEFARETLYTRYLKPFDINGKNIWVLLIGRSDKIMRANQTLIVQDDKFPTNVKKYDSKLEPYEDQILQALSYLNSKYTHDASSGPNEWFDIPHSKKVWIIRICDQNNNNNIYKIYKGVQNQEAKNYLNSRVERFAHLILGTMEKQHHNSADKCKPCRYKEQCKFSLV